jgi:dimethylhistidine N-methyltransferase
VTPTGSSSGEPSAARFSLVAGALDRQRDRFAEDVRVGLESVPKRLACRYFYDEEGSLLFEEICDLPEYYLTRAEREILEKHARTIGAFVPTATLVELGSGSASKTRLLIDAMLDSRPTLRYVPIDISPTMLEESSKALLADYDRLAITAIAAEYEDGLALLPGKTSSPRLIAWLGSNIGNLDRGEAVRFLSRLRAASSREDRVLCGIDLRKGRSVLEPAYEDARGVTARFNLNLLARINRELGGRFDLSLFRHRAVYDEVTGRVAMYLVSGRAQRVTIAALGLEATFGEGEAIHTEDSYKYSLAEIDSLAASAGFRVEARWLDGEQRFSLNLFAPA